MTPGDEEQLENHRERWKEMERNAKRKKTDEEEYQCEGHCKPEFRNI